MSAIVEMSAAEAKAAKAAEKKAARAAAKAIKDAAKAKAAEEAAKAAPKKPGKPDPVKSKRAMEIIASASSLSDYLAKESLTLDGFAYRTTKVPGLHVVRVPSVREAYAKLPNTDEAKAFIQIIRELGDSVAKLTGGSPKSTWVIRETGSTNIMGVNI